MSFLSPADIARVSLTCRDWRNLAEDNQLWKGKCEELGGAILDPPRSYLRLSLLAANVYQLTWKIIILLVYILVIDKVAPGQKLPVQVALRWLVIAQFSTTLTASLIYIVHSLMGWLVILFRFISLTSCIRIAVFDVPVTIVSFYLPNRILKYYFFLLLQLHHISRLRRGDLELRTTKTLEGSRQVFVLCFNGLFKASV